MKPLVSTAECPTCHAGPGEPCRRKTGELFEGGRQLHSNRGGTYGERVVDTAVWDVRESRDYPDRIAYLSDGWAVRFRGCVEAARWREQGAAEAHLQLLQSGARQPQPESLERMRERGGR